MNRWMTWILLTPWLVATGAETPWHDPALMARMDAGIEKIRKGDATIEVVDGLGKSVPDARIELRQTGHEFLFGANLFVLDQLATPELNAKYEAAFTNLFNFATLPFYWRDLEPLQGRPRFDEGAPYIWRRPPPDRLVAWCKAHDITPKGHALMYVKNMFMPDWTLRNDPEAFQRQITRHLATIASRYGRDIPMWDVVNEEIPRLRHSNEWHAVPEKFLSWGFQEADRLLPNGSKLFLNDGTSEAHVTTRQYATLIQGLLRQRARVDGVGIQFHISDTSALLSGRLYPPAQLVEAYNRLARLGFPLYITEITIPGAGHGGPELQGAAVANLYRLWFSTPSMAGITWWNLADGTAFERENDALGGLCDKGMNPKPAYQALDRLINHDWKTTLTLQTDAQGQARFRGFFGRYRIQVTTPSASQTFSVNHTKAARKTHLLTLNKPGS